MNGLSPQRCHSNITLVIPAIMYQAFNSNCQLLIPYSCKHTRPMYAQNFHTLKNRNMKLNFTTKKNYRYDKTSAGYDICVINCFK